MNRCDDEKLVFDRLLEIFMGKSQYGEKCEYYIVQLDQKARYLLHCVMLACHILPYALHASSFRTACAPHVSARCNFRADKRLLSSGEELSKLIRMFMWALKLANLAFYKNIHEALAEFLVSLFFQCINLKLRLFRPQVLQLQFLTYTYYSYCENSLLPCSTCICIHVAMI